jgi:hypothetical protein
VISDDRELEVDPAVFGNGRGYPTLSPAVTANPPIVVPTLVATGRYLLFLAGSLAVTRV